MIHQEYQYLDLLKKILENGKRHENRTGVATKRLLCEIMRFDLSEEFPLLTTKKMYWKGICHELLWFLSGSTSIKYLKDNNVHIWDGNAEVYYKKMYQRYEECGTFDGVEQAKFLKDNPFFKPEDPDDIGPCYPFQWRHFNGEPHQTKDPEDNHTGFDQISWAIDQIKNNPESRRIIVSAWNPLQIPHMCLPPCHFAFQFSVDEDRLHCTMFQRSADSVLGIPWNISSYSLLTCLVAHVCNIKPGIFNLVMNDAHIYENHIEQVKEQLTREPYPFPKIKINPDKNNIFDIKYDDIELIDYKHHPAIKAKMAV
jgi:thymidylate synthase